MEALAAVHRSQRYGLFRRDTEELPGALRFATGQLTEKARHRAGVVWQQEQIELREGRPVAIAGVGVFLPVARLLDRACRGLVYLERRRLDSDALEFEAATLFRLAQLLGEEAPPLALMGARRARSEVAAETRRLQLQHLLRRYQGRRSQVARHLGVSRRTIDHRVDSLGLEDWTPESD